MEETERLRRKGKREKVGNQLRERWHNSINKSSPIITVTPLNTPEQKISSLDMPVLSSMIVAFVNLVVLPNYVLGLVVVLV